MPTGLPPGFLPPPPPHRTPSASSLVSNNNDRTPVTSRPHTPPSTRPTTGVTTPLRGLPVKTPPRGRPPPRRPSPSQPQQPVPQGSRNASPQSSRQASASIPPLPASANNPPPPSSSSVSAGGALPRPKSPVNPSQPTLSRPSSRTSSPVPVVNNAPDPSTSAVAPPQTSSSSRLYPISGGTQSAQHLNTYASIHNAQTTTPADYSTSAAVGPSADTTATSVPADPTNGGAGLSYVSVVSRVNGVSKLYKLTLKGDISRLPVTTLKKALHGYTSYDTSDMHLTKDGVTLEDNMIGADVSLCPGAVLHLDLKSDAARSRSNVTSIVSPSVADVWARKRGASAERNSSAPRYRPTAEKGELEEEEDLLNEFARLSPRSQIQRMVRMKSELDRKMKRLDQMHAVWEESTRRRGYYQQQNEPSMRNGGAYVSNNLSPNRVGPSRSTSQYGFTDYQSPSSVYGPVF
eukprot:PhM_4_TR2757/c0_g1_i1/m.53772